MLALLAIAGTAVLAGRRMLDQTRRVGLLKAVGRAPGRSQRSCSPSIL